MLRAQHNLGILLTVALAALAPHCRGADGTHRAPYTNWFSAATDIQSAADAATGGTLIFVSNGLYETASEIVISNAVAIRGSDDPGDVVVAASGSSRVFRLNHPLARLRPSPSPAAMRPPAAAFNSATTGWPAASCAAA